MCLSHAYDNVPRTSAVSATPAASSIILVRSSTVPAEHAAEFRATLFMALSNFAPKSYGRSLCAKSTLQPGWTVATTLTMALYYNYITLSYIDWLWPFITTQYFFYHAHCRLLVVRAQFILHILFSPSTTTSICLGKANSRTDHKIRVLCGIILAPHRVLLHSLCNIPGCLSGLHLLHPHVSYDGRPLWPGARVATQHEGAGVCVAT